MPGQEKTDSARTLPVMTLDSCMPMTVMMGISALGNAWRLMTRFSEQPFARAVRM